jgi:hypothetical protein
VSSAVYIAFEEPVPVGAWLDFCKRNGVVFSPRTIGRNAFYKGEVEVHFGDASYADPPRLPDGRFDFDAVEPPASATTLTVESYWHTNLPEIADLARRVVSEFPSTWSADPELRRYVQEVSA